MIKRRETLSADARTSPRIRVRQAEVRRRGKLSIRKILLVVVVTAAALAGTACRSSRSPSADRVEGHSGNPSAESATNPLDFPVDPHMGVVPTTTPMNPGPVDVQGSWVWMVDPVTGQPVRVDPSTGLPVQPPASSGPDPGSPSTTASQQAATKITCKAAFTTMSNGSESRKFATITVTGAALVWAEFVEGDRKVVEPVDTHSGFALAAVPFGMSDPRLTVYGSATLDPVSTGCKA